MITLLAQLLSSMLVKVLEVYLQRKDISDKVKLEGALTNARNVNEALRFKMEVSGTPGPDVGSDFRVRDTSEPKVPSRDTKAT